MPVTLHAPTFDFTAPAVYFGTDGTVFTVDHEGAASHCDLNVDWLTADEIKLLTVSPGSGSPCVARVYYDEKVEDVFDFNGGHPLGFTLDEEETVCLHDPAASLFLLRLNNDGWGWVHRLAGEECGELVIGETAFLDSVYRPQGVILPTVAPLGPRHRRSPLAERRG
jgi:hypothetical protein